MCFEAFGREKKLKNMILKNCKVQKVRTRTERTVRVRFRFGKFVRGSGSGSDKRWSEPDWTELRQRYRWDLLASFLFTELKGAISAFKVPKSSF